MTASAAPGRAPVRAAENAAGGFGPEGETMNRAAARLATAAAPSRTIDVMPPGEEIVDDGCETDGAGTGRGGRQRRRPMQYSAP
ncbi:MAG: hypothetical protein OXI22_15505 [Defluviicoccus sp.]|nr:hypothetical protein [Defluviicoccus sp.]